MKTISKNKIFGGTQAVYEHPSKACGCDMRVGVFTPSGVDSGEIKDAPVLVWLSGLTCTEQNFITKAGAQRAAEDRGIILVTPDTSPRGDHVPDIEGRYDFGKGAGFYLDATQDPWAENYNMQRYITAELTTWIAENLPVDIVKLGIFGHSMGGHGALMLHLKNQDLYKTCSAFSPIVAPSQVPWGQKAFEDYLGDDKAKWANYDATALVTQSPSSANILIDQGLDDEFLAEHLRTDIFERACAKAGQNATIRMQPGYDHSYYFIATFIEDHIRHHAEGLTALKLS
ncbi:S-formylglutathione hydrolase [Robiginitomaculum antarcticum]|uniref:S-formylglutathione hydrolase n=1 Tax=Robiginitomaculum antarcticum TaxID=437507 RepID=UPI00037D5FF7|nr:S-formylglutathione hydrolase [Robiginitomaculum antarcticum]